MPQPRDLAALNSLRCSLAVLLSLRGLSSIVVSMCLSHGASAFIRGLHRSSRPQAGRGVCGRCNVESVVSSLHSVGSTGADGACIGHFVAPQASVAPVAQELPEAIQREAAVVHGIEGLSVKYHLHHRASWRGAAWRWADADPASAAPTAWLVGSHFVNDASGILGGRRFTALIWHCRAAWRWADADTASFMCLATDTFSSLASSTRFAVLNSLRLHGS